MRPVVTASRTITWQPFELSGRPAPGMVRLTSVRSLISPGTELALYEGREMVDGLNAGFSPAATSLVMDPLDDDISTKAELFPVALGYNLVGRVTAVGDGVDPGRIGTLAFAVARHQAEVEVADWEAVTLPESVDPAIAALYYLPTLGLSALRRVGYRSGERVAVIGLGLVGLCAALVAQSLGAEPVCFDTSEARRDFTAQLIDKDLIHDPRTARPLQFIGGGAGADVVVEAAGTRESLAFAAALAGVRARLVVLGLHSEDLGALFARNFYRKMLNVVFCGNDDYAPSKAGTLTSLDNVLEIARLERSGRLPLNAIITAEAGAHRIEEAFAMIANERPTGAVVLDWESPDQPLTARME
ncbi:zinc-dependent alcohol dehydrogenase [Amycolatopsis pithecellobii]|uniref:zinc-dependent alcohol dehydrogenase n=1 Tax=Amycolatopsis pithecellobii TaxID=664692 RepID=UPI00140C3480|nr:zinc-binding alcohol dehydrogenase [Amycolatopsis pithecellobii]